MNKFAVSDLHLGHTKILEFKNPQTGEPIRPFASLDDMHDSIIKNWNAVITPKDKVYIIGDIALGDRVSDANYVLQQLHGIKEIILGNHDKYDFHHPNKFTYEKYINKIHGAHTEKFHLSSDFTKEVNVCFTHIPIHPYFLDRFYFNIHGHSHSTHVKRPYFVSEIMEWCDIQDDRYINVSVEAVNYTPVKIIDIIQERYDNIKKWNQTF